MEKPLNLKEYTIRWKYGEFEGIRIVVADDEEFAAAKLWWVLERDYRPKHNRIKKHRIIKTENYHI